MAGKNGSKVQTEKMNRCRMSAQSDREGLIALFFFAPQQSPLPGRSAVGNNHGLHWRLSSFGRKQFRNGLGNPDFSFKRFRYSGMRKAERAIQGLPAPA